MQCAACGHNNPDDADFCEQCAGDLIRACGACGTQNTPTAKFCKRCRASLAHGVSGSTAAAVPEPAAPIARPLPASFARGRYAVSRFLGEGGRKRVYLARDAKLKRDVAIAVIKTEGLEPASLARVQREVEAMAQLGDHPNVVTIYDVGEDEGQPYIVSQYMAGGSVDDAIRAADGQRLPVEQVLRIARQVCDALEHAHDHGIIHRDVKPGNIWLAQDGTAQLGDFGLALAAEHARMTTEGTMLGTVAYMPPEQALGQPAVPQSDLYSLGCMLYEALTGRPPFVGDDAVAVISQHLNATPVASSWHNPAVSPELEALIDDLLVKVPARRPANAALVRERLLAISTTSTAAVRPPDTGREPGVAHLAWGRLIGRHEELAVLRDRIDLALSGAGSLTMVVGEPGIGKTRLTEEAAVYARVRDAQVLWGRCYESEAALPYRPFIEAIRQYVAVRAPEALRSELGSGGSDVARLVSEVRERLPDLPPSAAGEGDADRLRLFESVTSFLVAASKATPLVIVLDDLHWADAPSLLLLQHLARRVAESRIAVVGTYRDVELDRKHPLSAALGELRQKRLYERIRLHGLQVAEISALLAAVGQQPEETVAPAFAHALYQETEGNPFFIEEILRHLVETGALYRRDDRWVSDADSIEEMGIPEGVREVIGRRLSRLSETCNNALVQAAVLGRDWEFSVLRAMTELNDDELLPAIEEALDAQLIVELKDRAAPAYQFTHALVQQTLSDELSLPRRQRFHFRAGEAVEQVHARSIARHVQTLAVHYELAGAGGDREKALRYAMQAGEAARAIYAFEDAVHHAEAAVEILEETGASQDQVAEQMERLGDLYYFGGLGMPASTEWYEKALSLYERTGNDRRAARIHSRIARVLSFGGHRRANAVEAMRHLKAAEPALSAEGPRVSLGLFYAGVADAAMSLLQIPDLVAAAARVTEIADEIGNEALATNGMGFRGIALVHTGRIGEGMSLLEEAWRRAVEQRNGFLRWHAVLFHAFFDRALLDPGSAARIVVPELDEPETREAKSQRTVLFDLFLDTRVAAGRRAEWENATSRRDDIGDAAQLRASQAFWDGDWASATDEWTRTLDRLRQQEARQNTGVFVEELGWAERARVNPAGARAALEPALRLAADGGAVLCELALAAELALAELDLGDLEAARTLVARCREISANGEDWRGREGRILVAEALIDIADGREREAEQRIETALSIFRKFELPWFEAEAQHVWGRILADAGQRRAALDRFDAALGIYRNISAGGPWLELVLADRFRLQGVDIATDVMTSIEAVANSVGEERPSLPQQALAPDGTVTIMFSDIEDSTVLTERLGDQAWQELLRKHNALIREQLQTYGGYEVKTMGDGFMIAFQSAKKGLDCAIAIQKAFDGHNAADGDHVKVRIGLHAGEMIKDGDDFYGKNVIMASRVAGKAVGGEILVSSLLRQLVESSVGAAMFGEPRGVELKGLSGTHEVYAVTLA